LRRSNSSCWRCRRRASATGDNSSKSRHHSIQRILLARAASAAALFPKHDRLANLHDVLFAHPALQRWRRDRQSRCGIGGPSPPQPQCLSQDQVRPASIGRADTIGEFAPLCKMALPREKQEPSKINEVASFSNYKSHIVSQGEFRSLANQTNNWRELNRASSRWPLTLRVTYQIIFAVKLELWRLVQLSLARRQPIMVDADHGSRRESR
jgi:hypothetical protein